MWTIEVPKKQITSYTKTVETGEGGEGEVAPQAQTPCWDPQPL